MGLGGGTARLLFLLTFFTSGIHLILSDTDPGDAAALQSLKRQWQNTPPSWGQSHDPCGAPWEGVTCSNSRITALGLSTMSLKGKLSGDIGGLTELRSLDLSFNTNLTGSLTPRLGDLLKLNILILAGCGFSGSIPDELGNLAELSFLALNSNNFSGGIPPSLGKLSKLYWLDFADNQLTGPIPISKNTTPGLDLLLNAKHLLFDGNQLEGNIPSTLGLVQTLEVLRLDRNALSGKVPINLNNLSSLNELNLAHNKLIGPLPNLTKLDALNYVDLSNNSFFSSEAPDWFSTLPSLTTLVIEHGSLQGTLPSKVFSFPQIQQVLLRNNALNGSFNMGDSISTQLQLVDLQNNQISSVTLTADYTNTLILVGNPVCTALSDTNYCQLQQQSTKPYSTSLANCGKDLPSGNCPMSEIQSIGFDLTNQTYKPPKEFGPYYFIASPYPFPDSSRGNSLSTGVVVGIGTGCGLLVMSLVGVAIYAIRQKKRAEKAIGLSKPFASWAPSGKDSGGVPQLKGARWFSYEELKRCTYNFTESNEIGSGGYGKVY
ncbi:LEUCINE-RICH REPEAT-CONTAINING PROTEIN [Salix koriyanagi]|uniref:non-specific serine/threonine protein kinase n=1 Tax=Salix koriyanagi TaxID=2511006 RepID=A0A9Q0V0R7_9ROSI|nr:LEUCINE-RICH REPEAT-CONTAINING PROTEIN [Salix koriyanagi]